ncbi:ankyrin repeat domain-containing protein [bacterium]|nr:MAG: ankyrin repeat domain-containing protein [bacterium]
MNKKFFTILLTSLTLATNASSMIPLWSELVSIVKCNNHPALRALIQTNLAQTKFNLANMQHFNTGISPLHSAAQLGHVECLSTLLEEGALVNIADHFQHTPLHYAAHEGKVECVKELIKHEAYVNCQNRLKQTPLHLAAIKGHDACVKILVENGAKTMAFDESGQTPAVVAAKHGHTQLAEILTLIARQTQQPINPLPKARRFPFGKFSIGKKS